MKPKTLLVVDDCKDFRLLLVRTLVNSFNVEVIPAKSGADALEVLHTHAVDLVISDCNMPGIDGIQLVKIVLTRYSDVACLLVTSAVSHYSPAAKEISLPLLPKSLPRIVGAVEAFFARRSIGVSPLPFPLLKEIDFSVSESDGESHGHRSR